MSFKEPIRYTTSVALDASSAVPAASDAVLSRKLKARASVGITAVGSTIYIGGPDVNSSNGMPIAAGDSIVIPVVSDRADNVYVVGGQCIITEFFA